MKLKHWLKLNKFTGTRFGALIGVKAQAVYRYADGDRIPRKEVMEKITTVTRGKVRPDDFYSAAKGARESTMS
jgi:hypothetical protein